MVNETNNKKYVYFFSDTNTEINEIYEALKKGGTPCYKKASNGYVLKYSDCKNEITTLSQNQIPVFIDLRLSNESDWPENSVSIDSGLLRAVFLHSFDLFHELRKQGATLEQVEAIRSLQKYAAQITEEDECAAVEALKNLQEPLPGVAWIESKTEKTELILDRIWGRYRTIIIKLPDGRFSKTGDEELIAWLCDHYATRTDETCCPKCGDSKPLSPISEEDIPDEIKKCIEPISQHIFLFPFIASRYDDHSPIDSQRLQMLFDLLKKNWSPEPFEVFECSGEGGAPDDCLHYDEYSYFHDYVRKALFNFNAYAQKKDAQEKETSFVEDTDAISCFFRYPLVAPSTFQLDIASKFDQKSKQAVEHHYPYRLALKGITLRLFKTGVAILGFELHNYCYNQLEDVLRINDFGRRVYPQFMEDSSLMFPKEKFLADAITIDLGAKSIIESFDFKDYKFRHKQERFLNIGRHILDLLGNSICEQFYINPIIDDRMFTLCWYADKELTPKLVRESRPQYIGSYQKGPVTPENECAFETSEEWFRFVFIDGNGCTCPDDRMRRELLAASTYRRWAPWETIYGISRYSLMCLSTPSAPSFMREHMRRHYRQMVELVLAQRASMIIFSSRISALSGRIDDLKDPSSNRTKMNALSKEVRTLQGDYIGFVNRLWFEEVTPQEQGIEMYDMIIRNMRMKEQMQELKDEIKELYEFMEMQETNTMNDTMLKLTQIATFGLPVTLVLAFWGISTGFVEMIDFRKPISSDQGWIWVIVSVLLAILLCKQIISIVFRCLNSLGKDKGAR